MIAYLLKNKSEAQFNLMNYIQKQNAKRYICARIRLDHGEECSSVQLKNFCQQRGIEM